MSSLCSTHRPSRNFSVFSCVSLFFINFLLLRSLPYGTSAATCPSPCECPSPNKIVCTNKRLTRIPHDVPVNTIELDLTGNRIILSPRCFDSLHRLKTLVLKNCQLRNLNHETFAGLKSLASLDLSQNLLRENAIHKEIFLPLGASLHSLDLSSNKFEDVGRMFTNLPLLSVLNLAGNSIHVLRNGTFTSNSALRDLHLERNSIWQLEAGVLSPLPHLRHLWLSHNPLGPLTEETQAALAMPRLQFADLTNCSLRMIPGSFQRTLRDLRLPQNEFQILRRNEFSSVPYLSRLILSSSNIEDVEPETFSNLALLFSIDLKGNKLKRLPKLPHEVQYAYLDGNNIQSIPRNHFLSTPKLKFISVSNNDIAQVSSSSFHGLRDLQQLDLSGNKIETLGRERAPFAKLSSLRKLSLARNPIREMGIFALAGIRNLEDLDLSSLAPPGKEAPQISAGIEDAPEVDVDKRLFSYLVGYEVLREIVLQKSDDLCSSFLDSVEDSDGNEKAFKNLKVVDLSFCGLTELRPSVRNRLENLETLWLHGNPLKCDGETKWLADWIQFNPHLFKNGVKAVRCHSPDRFYNEALVDVYRNWIDATTTTSESQTATTKTGITETSSSSSSSSSSSPAMLTTTTTTTRLESLTTRSSPDVTSVHEILVDKTRLSPAEQTTANVETRQTEKPAVQIPTSRSIQTTNRIPNPTIYTSPSTKEEFTTESRKSSTSLSLLDDNEDREDDGHDDDANKIKEQSTATTMTTSSHLSGKSEYENKEEKETNENNGDRNGKQLGDDVDDVDDDNENRDNYDQSAISHGGHQNEVLSGKDDLTDDEDDDDDDGDVGIASTSFPVNERQTGRRRHERRTDAILGICVAVGILIILALVLICIFAIRRKRRLKRYNVKEKSLCHEKASSIGSSESELKNLKHLDAGDSFCYFLNPKPDLVENGAGNVVKKGKVV